MGVNKIHVHYTDIIIVIFLFVCLYVNMCVCLRVYFSPPHHSLDSHHSPCHDRRE